MRRTSGRAKQARSWGRPIVMSRDVITKIDALWSELGIDKPLT